MTDKKDYIDFYCPHPEVGITVDGCVECPLMEQAKKQERERIIERLRQLMSVIQNRDKYNGVRDSIKVIQALAKGRINKEVRYGRKDS